MVIGMYSVDLCIKVRYITNRLLYVLSHRIRGVIVITIASLLCHYCVTIASLLRPHCVTITSLLNKYLTSIILNST